ncbi:MAG: tRNA 2-selenouridine(34) synthase MnmH [Betaproteobacteria bacterium]|nr:tRNA 2-selenouridine(34) synthase MnmH [Betaproteobacteria bacterium]
MDSATVAQLHDFDEVIDARSPSEFLDDHIPGARSLPVLDDAERASVGTLYKQTSPFEAKKQGAALVARNIARHLDRHFSDKPKGWRPLVYCWRGGKRSGALTHVLREVGFDAQQLEGGYKAYRRAVMADLDRLPCALQFHVVCGLTGTGKSRLLQALRLEGAQVLDLEALASHRGSVLGGLPLDRQPPQKLFESMVWDALTHMDPSQPVYVESESQRIGNLRVPDVLIQSMRQGRCLRVEADRAVRLRLLKEEYAHFLEDPDTLCRQLDYLVNRHGHGMVHAWKTLAAQGEWDALVADLLEKHYDPAYRQSITRHFPQFLHARPVHVADSSDESLRQSARLALSSAD